ncbi:hypothetical protein [Mucilaginibacter terrae]|uniref:Lipoprotein n=1 Tax=Mucilaginibacter terrae TaxID=1955052 RepID=A0ABU3H0P3_9SPHI|nr:hypothetical protein [Mucilaginibacter terrae]MDT3405585.1 hypothetical protein [Mucilaginibacter terrae]
MKTLNNLKHALKAVVILTLITACKKDNCENSDRLSATSATVIDGCTPAADGCGWLIRVDNINYSPDNLPESFKIDNIKVDISYSVSERKFACGFNANGPNFIHLYDIKR